ncbi:hypothetical protein [Priestia megaterium]|uniref:hypothetical protein n=1 Tax=Priestia megaterium TaxID=1404 RepID=UPI002877BB3D|nr:hypothetical protein [Priestia megaterium]
MNDFQANVIEKVSKLERTATDHERRIQNQEDTNETLNKLTVLVELLKENGESRDQYQRERDEQQNEQMKEFSATMRGVNANLTQLNSQYSDLNQRVGNIEGTRWSWDDLFRKVIPAVLIAVIVAGFTYWLGLK